MDAANLHIGTSGWHYRHWRGVFYPPALRSGDWLAYYAARLGCVEVNNSFYRFPRREVIENWIAQAPPGFVFALKASRYITHQKKLKDCREPVERFLEQAEVFAGHLGPILFQLPPHWHANLERLRAFLKLLPPRFRYAIEFRDPSWLDDGVYALLRAQGVAFCQYQLAGFSSPRLVTSDLVYVRLHGPDAAAYCGGYSDRELGEWAHRIERWIAEGRELYLFFDNDEAGHAVADARRLLAMCADA